MTTVLLVDDHKSLLAGTKLLLEKHNMDVTTCSSGVCAIDILKERKFDVMIYDLKMPDMDGLALTKKTLEIYPDATIIIFSGEDIASNFNLLIKAGVSAIVDKACSDTQFIASISMALEKMVVLPLELVKDLRLGGSSIEESGIDSNYEALTQYEIEILKFASKGKTNKEISEELKLAQRSIEYHLSHIYKKLNVHSRVYAIRKAIQLNLINQ